VWRRVRELFAKVLPAAISIRIGTVKREPSYKVGGKIALSAQDLSEICLFQSMHVIPKTMAAFVTFLKDRGVDGASVGRVFHHVLLLSSRTSTLSMRWATRCSPTWIASAQRNCLAPQIEDDCPPRFPRPDRRAAQNSSLIGQSIAREPSAQQFRGRPPD
jgi:hypothetical protein